MIARALPLLFALVVGLGVYAWSVGQQRERAETAARQATEQRDTLAAALAKERSAQARLRTTQDSLRAELARRHSQIEDLKHENQELRDWAAQPLPAAARRLRERPALTGTDAYQDWLSGRGAVPPSGDRAGQ